MCVLSKWGGGAESRDVCEKEEDELVCEREGARELCYHQKLSWAFSLDSFFFFYHESGLLPTKV